MGRVLVGKKVVWKRREGYWCIEVVSIRKRAVKKFENK